MASNDPVITSAIYDGGKVRVFWTPSADIEVIGYVISLVYLGQAAGQAAYASPVISGQDANFGTLTLPGALNTDVSYQVIVTAMWDSGPGQVSVPVTLPTARPGLVSAVYDGAQVSFEWTPSWQAAQGYQLIVYSTDSGTTYNATVASPQASTGVIPASAIPGGLASDQQWMATVAALGENAASARSAEGTFPKPLTQPALSPATIYQDRSRILAGWSPLSSGGLSGYRLSLTSPEDRSEQWVELTSASAANGILPLAAPLSANKSYAFQVVALGSGGAGVGNVPVPVVTTTPVIAAALYDTTEVRLSWAMPFNPAVTGFTLQVVSLSSGAQFTSDVSGGSAASGQIPLANPLDPTQEWVCRVIANGPLPSQTGDTPLPVTPVALQTVAVEGRTLNLTWTAAVPAPEKYVVTLFSAGSAVASAVSAGTAASLPLPDGLTSPTLRTAAQTGVATGPNGTAVPVLDAAPQVSGFATDAVTGISTLSWSEISGATAYLLELSDGTTVSVSSASYAFPDPLPVSTPASVSIRAQSATGGATSTGPPGPPFTLATAQPAILSAGYDGVEATASWAPVAGASGYRISVLKAGTPVTVETSFDAPGSAVSGAWPYTPAQPGATYSVAVQARFQSGSAAGSGPASPALPLFQSGFFTSASPASTAYPYLFPAAALATAMATTPSAEIALYLPQIGGAEPLSGLPITEGPFTLATNPDTATSAAYPYRLSMAADSEVWSFDTAPIRTALRSSYIAFLKTVESTGGATPWGILLLQNAISRYMPQTFQELLYYAYGLSFPSLATGDTLGYADLRPGMVLRVIADPYQTVTESSSLQWSNGYVGGPAVDYEVGSFVDTAGATTTGTDSFIGQLVAGGAMTVLPPPSHASTQQAGGIADAADLYFPGFRTPFYRLFAPAALAGASAPCPTNTPSNFVIAAAATYNDLLLTGNVPGGASPIVYFRGRAVLRPCLRVTLDGAQLTVPVGATVGNLLEQAGRATPPASLAMTDLSVKRGLGAAVTDAAAPLSTGAYYAVRFDWKTQAAFGPGWTPLSLPLLPGDIVSTGGR